MSAGGATASSLPSGTVALRVGDEMPSETMGPLTRTDFVRYAGAGGDFNPIHHDEPMAVAFGLPSVFGMGMLHAGKLGTCLSRWVGPNNLTSFAVRFTGQVWPGDVLTFSGSVTEVSTGANPSASVQLTVARQSGEVVLTGSAATRISP
ncbi:MAG TPA: MaoC/PaaZ C-terminal domain-containing protein [Solirubrobacteraceae bacterium]|nr:MaoC/PaaZ C-terminal domain-containing protein [Solirubrobacteraceae bacterium]